MPVNGEPAGLPSPRKRADARRNEQTLLDAAADVFVTSGVEAHRKGRTSGTERRFRLWHVVSVNSCSVAATPWCAVLVRGDGLCSARSRSGAALKSGRAMGSAARRRQSGLRPNWEERSSNQPQQLHLEPANPDPDWTEPRPPGRTVASPTNNPSADGCAGQNVPSRLSQGSWPWTRSARVKLRRWPSGLRRWPVRTSVRAGTVPGRSGGVPFGVA